MAVQTEKTILRCGKLFTAADDCAHLDMAVTVEGDRITAVTPWAEADTAQAHVVDLSDKFVMPGLIDAHVHVNMDGKTGVQSLFSEYSAAQLTIESIRNAQADLMAGFTTIRDEGAAHYTDVAVRNAFQSGVVTGPRMVVSGRPLTATGGHADGRFAPHNDCEFLGIVCNSPAEMRAAVRRNLKYGADQIKIMATGGVISMGSDPRCSEFTLDEMKAAVDAAKLQGKRTSAHAHGCDGIKIAVRAGITTIEHGMLMDDECIELMAQNGTYLVPTIIAAKTIAEAGPLGLPGWMVDKAQQVVEGHWENLKKCRAAGISIGFGSDAGTSFNRHGEQMVELEYMTQAGFSPAEVLIAATRTNAELLDRADTIGTLEPGKYADIVAFDQDLLQDLRGVRAASFLMKGGAILKH